jgi:hypothetical protein
MPLCLPANFWCKQIANCFHSSFSVCALPSLPRRINALPVVFFCCGSYGSFWSLCQKSSVFFDYATELNPCCQQDLFPFMQPSSGRPQTDVRQSNHVLIHTRKGSSNFNELLSSLAGDLVAHLSSRDIPNNDAGEEEDFSIVHDDSYDENAVGDKLSV